MKKPALLALGVGVLSVFLWMVVPAQAMAAETSETPETLTQEARYLQGEAVPSFPQELTRDGKTYDLVQVSPAIVSPNYQEPVEAASSEEASQVLPEDYGRLDELFPTEKQITDGDYAGAIPRVEYLVTPNYETFSEQVDKNLVINDLPSNEVGQIPTEAVFNVRSAAGIDAEQEKTLTLLDVAFQVDQTDATGRPLTWTATCTYRGEESYLAIHHYDVIARYAGEIASTVPQLLVKATYTERVAAAPAPVPAPSLVTPTPPTPTPPAPAVPVPPASQPQTLQLLPLIIGGGITVALALGWLLLYLLLLRTNIRLVQLGARPRTLVRRRLAVSRAEAHFALPADLDLFDQAYAFQLKVSLASQPGRLVVTYRGQIIMKATLAPTISLNLAEASALAAAAGIFDELIEEDVA